MRSNKKALVLILAFLIALPMMAQRQTDKLNRGLVAMKSGINTFCSWRMLENEYFDVSYNIYKDGTKLNDTPLKVTNYTDKMEMNPENHKYSIEAVVNGVAQGKSEEVAGWKNNYLDIKLAPVKSRYGTDITAHYEPNDASMADLDGDGEMEIILKRKSLIDANSTFATENDSTYDVLEAYKLDGTRLWYIDVGPNMVSGSSVETNIVAYDWDGDGKAEVLLRGADNMIIHKADGSTQTIGDAKVNTRNTVSHTANMTYTNTGAEFLLYLNGMTAEPYVVMDFPLPRGNANDWGDGYGHRSSKYFFGAPFLDGRKASIFLARGIYTMHKMIAFDVDPQTHKLTQRWYWECKDSKSPWWGNGYHNYGIADVDWDGRDEIVFGSMVIDDNGKGLSTTGLGHGDAQHCRDFDPYRHGQELFTCNETKPNNCYRDATTSTIYYRSVSNNDDGRAMMGNFTNKYPGSLGTSAHDGNVISSVTDKKVFNSGGIDQNFRIYWDGDLLDETFNYSGFVTNNGYYETGNPRIVKYNHDGGGSKQLFSFDSSKTCNGTKGTPTFQGDVLGDWREEMLLRTDDGNLRLFVSKTATEYALPTLWSDMQYRQAMVWQMCGYNQPPHTSYFLGELEGITMAPPSLTMTDRTEVANNGTIGSSLNGKQVIACETNDMTINVSNGAKPYVFFVNAPSWVQGHDDNDNITRQYFTHTVKGGAFEGSMRLVKQGDGTLVLPAVAQKYTGETSVWAGTLQFDGTMEKSRVWLNRHTALNSDGGKFMNGIVMDYNATLRPGGADKKGSVTTDSLIMNFGSRLELDLFSEGNAADMVTADVLKIEKKNWSNGPKYNTPVIYIIQHPLKGEMGLAAGKYLIGKIGKIEGDINDIKIESLKGIVLTLSHESGNLYLNVNGMRSNGEVHWNGDVDNRWNEADTENFLFNGEKNIFVPGDDVVFDDKAATFSVEISSPVAPKSVVFANDSKAYTIGGDSIVGAGTLTKNGSADVSINNINRFEGGTFINKGRLFVSSLANKDGLAYGALGGIRSEITIDKKATLAVNENTTTTQPLKVGKDGAQIETGNGVTLTVNSDITSQGKGSLYKTGNGTLELNGSNSFGKMYIEQGTVNAPTDIKCFADTVVFNSANATLYHHNTNTTYSSDYTNFLVPKGKYGTLYLDGRCHYYGSLSGEGIFRVFPQFVRNYLCGDFSRFEGTLEISANGGYTEVPVLKGFKISDKATIKVNEGAAFSNTDPDKGSSIDFALPNIDGKGAFTGKGTYIIGENGNDISFQGKFMTNVKKRGDGEWSVSNTAKQDEIGSVIIEGGRLFLNTFNTKTTIMGNSTINVNSGAMICGTGAVGSVMLNSGATVAPGRPSADDKSGYVIAEKNFTAMEGSVIALNFKSAANTAFSRAFIEAGEQLTVNGRVDVTLSPTYTPAIGDVLILWSSASFSGNPTFNLPELPSNMKWDTTEALASEGKLKIAASTGIDVQTADETVRCRLYTTSGMLVGEFEGNVDNVMEKASQAGVAQGTYILRAETKNSTKSLKVVIK